MAPIRSEALGFNLRLFVIVILMMGNVILFCGDNCFKIASAAPISNVSKFNYTDGLSLMIKRDNGSVLESQSHTEAGPIIVGGTLAETLEYAPSLILRCEAYGNSKPNVSWNYNGKPLILPSGFLIPKEEHDDLDNNKNYNNADDKLQNIININNNLSSSEASSSANWVDFKLPKMNMAFYGTFDCIASNEDGVVTKSYLIIPNANSSVFMKLVRGTIAVVALLLSVAGYRLCQIYAARRKVRKYEKLPQKDLQMIQRFRKGIPKRRKSSMMMTMKKTVKSFELQCTSSLSTVPTINADSLDVSMCSMNSTETELEINSWINYTAYDDRKEILKDSFKIDFENVLSNTEYGLILSGNFRSPKTMTWKAVGVKTVKTERDNISILRGLLMELKVLTSLGEENDFIVNLQAAFTHKLYKRQVYVFVDYCENGTLDKYIDLNRPKFRDLFARTPIVEEEVRVQPPKKKFRIVYNKENDENENPSPKKSTNHPKGGFSTEELVVWSAEIADGMRFLHKNKVSHGNLCTANIFLTSDLEAKVGNISHQPKECYKDNRRFPPECRLNSEYSQKSDVWTYGMTLYEMFSLRQQPQPTYQDLTEFYSSGKRPISPKHSNKDLDELLYFCWNPDGNLRPEFGHLSESIRLILNTLHTI